MSKMGREKNGGVYRKRNNKTQHQRGGIYDMKKILLSVLAAVVMLSLSFPQLSLSEIKEGSIEIAPFAGYYFLDH